MVVEPAIEEVEEVEAIEEMPTEEVTLYAEIMPTPNDINMIHRIRAPIRPNQEKGLADLSQDELFAKLQNYKKLFDRRLNSTRRIRPIKSGNIKVFVVFTRYIFKSRTSNNLVGSFCF